MTREVRDARSPNLFVVGAMKAGTTALYDLLDSHPAICMSPIKEPNHFGTDLPVPSGTAFGWDPSRFQRFASGSGPPPHQAYVRDDRMYRDLFADCSARWRGEASVSYLFSEVAVREIVASCPDSRFVVVLRDPIARLVSHHGSEVAIGREVERDLLRAVGRDLVREQAWGQAFLYVGLGLYGPQIRRLFEAAGRDSVLVLFFDDLVGDPPGTGFRLGEFLGVDPAGFRSPVNRNEGVAPRFHRLNVWLRRLGAKAALSRIAPRGLLDLGKRLFYRSGRSSEPLADGLESELRGLFIDSDRTLWDVLRCDPRWPLAGGGDGYR